MQSWRILLARHVAIFASGQQEEVVAAGDGVPDLDESYGIMKCPNQMTNPSSFDCEFLWVSVGDGDGEQS